MPTKDRLAGKTKQGAIATSIVYFGWYISIPKATLTNSATFYSIIKYFTYFLT
jgi:hypothetical protein